MKYYLREYKGFSSEKNQRTIYTIFPLGSNLQSFLEENERGVVSHIKSFLLLSKTSVSTYQFYPSLKEGDEVFGYDLKIKKIYTREIKREEFFKLKSEGHFSLVEIFPEFLI